MVATQQQKQAGKKTVIYAAAGCATGTAVPSLWDWDNCPIPVRLGQFCPLRRGGAGRGGEPPDISCGSYLPGSLSTRHRPPGQPSRLYDKHPVCPVRNSPVPIPLIQ